MQTTRNNYCSDNWNSFHHYIMVNFDSVDGYSYLWSSF